MRQRRGNVGQPGQGMSDRCLADAQIRIVGSLPLLIGRNADTGAKTHAHHTEKNANFIRCQRPFAMIAPDHVSRRSQGVGLFENGVGHGNGQIPHGIAENHITKIDDADHMLVAVGEILAPADDDVKIIGVVVDDASGEAI